MRRLLAASPVLALSSAAALAACGSSMPPSPPTNSAGERGCPGPEDVHLARWQPASAGGDTYGRPAVDHWEVPLGSIELGFDEPLPPFGPTDEADLRRLGLTPLPPTVWLHRAGAAACAARVIGYDREFLDPGPRSVKIAARLDGCALAGASGWETGWVVTGDIPPDACHLVAAHDGGQFVGDEADGRFEVPATAAPLPASIAAVEPSLEVPPECAAGGGCERLWSLVEVDSSPRLAELTVTWLRAGPSDDACGWFASDHRAWYATDASGAPRPLAATPAEEVADSVTAEDFDLRGVMVDGTGARLLLATDVARFAIVPLAPGGATGPARVVRYFVPHEEDGAWRSLAPYCGP